MARAMLDPAQTCRRSGRGWCGGGQL